MAKLNIQYKELKEIRLYNNNSKKHPEEQIDKIAMSIKEFGFNVPILLDKDNTIIAGHGRVMAARKLGIEQIPVIIKEDLTPQQVKAFRIADNKIAESSWDKDLLKEEFQAILDQDYDWAFTGYEEDEIQKILKEKDEREERIDDAEDVNRLGQLEITCPFCGKKFKKKKDR